MVDQLLQAIVPKLAYFARQVVKVCFGPLWLFLFFGTFFYLFKVVHVWRLPPCRQRNDLRDLIRGDGLLRGGIVVAIIWGITGLFTQFRSGQQILLVGLAVWLVAGPAYWYFYARGKPAKRD